MLTLYCMYMCVCFIYIIPLQAEMMLPFAHFRWKGQSCSNIDTIDMFAETGEKETDGNQVKRQRFIYQIYALSVGRLFRLIGGRH